MAAPETAAAARRHKPGPKPKAPKRRVIVRIHKALRTVLEDLADEQGTRAATLLQAAVREQMAAQARTAAPYTVSDDAAVYLLTRTEGQIAAKQMTLYLTENEYTALEAMAAQADVTKNQLVTCLLTDHLIAHAII